MLNVIALMGRLTREPELRVTPGGTSVCTVTLAVERDYVERGGERETDYIDVVSWGKTAEFVARYFRKGLLVGCQGRLQTRKCATGTSRAARRGSGSGKRCILPNERGGRHRTGGSDPGACRQPAG